MRVVADTNVVLSGLFWAGPPRRLIDLGQSGRLTFVTSEELVAELARVLGRAKFSARLRQLRTAPGELVIAWCELVELVEPAQVGRTVFADPDDDAVVAAAIGGNAEVIVSGDHHLRDLSRVGSIPIVSASEAVAMVERPS